PLRERGVRIELGAGQRAQAIDPALMPAPRRHQRTHRRPRIQDFATHTSPTTSATDTKTGITTWGKSNARTTTPNHTLTCVRIAVTSWFSISEAGKTPDCLCNSIMTSLAYASQGLHRLLMEEPDPRL